MYRIFLGHKPGEIVTKTKFRLIDSLGKYPGLHQGYVHRSFRFDCTRKNTAESRINNFLSVLLAKPSDCYCRPWVNIKPWHLGLSHSNIEKFMDEKHMISDWAINLSQNRIIGRSFLSLQFLIGLLGEYELKWPSCIRTNRKTSTTEMDWRVFDWP